MLAKQRIYLVVLATLALVTSGCQPGSGGRFFSGLGLDVTSLSALDPSERALICIAETEGTAVASFKEVYATILADFESNPGRADWSEPVCLSLSAQAEPWQIEQTIALLQLMIDVDHRDYQVVRGFQALMQQRLDYLHWRAAENKQWQERIAEEQLLREQQGEDYRDSLQQQQQRLAKQQLLIQELEQQVRKLKEVELMLHPQPNAPR